jgi:hypothetical protein
MNDFEFQLMLSPHTEPRELVGLWPSFDEQKRIEIAHECLKKESWGHLAAMQAQGFDLAKSHSLGTKELSVDETLIHRCLRIHLYEGADRVAKLLEMGADPHRLNGQGISPLGLLCTKARDLPNHRTIEFFDVLEEYGVRMSDTCCKGGLSRHLLDSDKAEEILAKYCPELVPWAQQKLLQETTPSASARSMRRL